MGKATRRRIILAGGILAAWLALTASGGALHHAAWRVDPAGQRSVLASGPLRPVANVMGVAAKPGWMVVVRVGPAHHGAMRSLRWAMVAHGLAWRALGGVREDVPRVLLSHNPDVADNAALRALGVDLMLCGHTHGGQVRLPLVGAPIVPVRSGQRYADGLNAGPACPVVTGRGVGMSVLPVRFNCPPEVVEVTLRSRVVFRCGYVDP